MRNIRWYVFWLLDFLRGSPVGRYYRNVKSGYQTGTSPERIKVKTQDLINHAIETTEFYSRHEKVVNISNLPVVNKNIYRAEYTKFISCKYKNKKSNRIMYTSGSTGTPFAMIQNKDKILHNTAASIFICSLGDYYIGDKQAFIRAWVDENKKSKLRAFIENITMIDTTRLDDKAINKILDVLVSGGYKSIFSYASSLIAINNYMNENRINFFDSNVRSIISMSETLPEQIRKDLRKKFSCSTQSTYSNEENGIMGIQYSSSPEYYLDTESYLFEFLKLDSDEPVLDGELGRIVVTDLYNYAFPIIRYDTGDLAVHRKSKNSTGYKVFIEELYGRRIDMIKNSCGELISPHAITNNMWGAEGIKQYQLVQLSHNEYDLVLVPDAKSINEKDIKDRIIPILGEKAKLNLKYKDEIPVLSSGKRKTFVNLS